MVWRTPAYSQWAVDRCFPRPPLTPPRLPLFLHPPPGVLKNQETYEIIRPEVVGLLDHNNMVLGKLSGRHALNGRLEELGYGHLSKEQLQQAFKTFKKTADSKRVYVVAWLLGAAAKCRHAATTHMWRVLCVCVCVCVFVLCVCFCAMCVFLCCVCVFLRARAHVVAFTFPCPPSRSCRDTLLHFPFFPQHHRR